jgi:ATP-dependent Clp protease ATP-binding subunit ClpC
MAGFDFVAKRALDKARAYANYNKEKEIRVCHVIYGIITDTYENFATTILMELNVDIELLKDSVELLRLETINSDGKKQKKIKYSTELDEILRYAQQNHLPFNAENKASVADIFMACMEIENEMSELLLDYALEPKTFKDVAYDIYESEIEIGNMDLEYDYDYDYAETTSTPDSKPSGKIDTIKKYCTHLTQLARENELPPCYGRNKELELVYRILLRRKKRNPMLIGREGVGKTNLVEGLAYNIIKKEVPEKLLNKEIYSLNLNSLIAGTKYRGMFEERVEKILEELAKNENIILFIDEIHTIIGAGNAEGSSDMSNMLKPYMSRKGFQIIGATTTNEYKKYIEKDKALKRRFSEVQVKEPSIETSIEILNSIKPIYEQEHNVSYTEKAIEACVTLSEKYITYRTLPDKAIDILDDVAVKKRMVKNDNTTFNKLQKKYRNIEQVKREIIDTKDYGRAEDIKKQSNLLLMEIKREKNKIKQQQQKILEITEEDVREIIEETTNIPVSQDGVNIKGLREHLKSNVIGQDHAIDNIVKTLLINKLNLDDGDKPIGSFLFVGYSGVGKTKITRETAKYLFGDDKFLIRIDCSEYQQSHQVTKLIGAPAGYVGYHEGGILTEAVKRNPFSVILIDELEKAHNSFFDILLQILGEGRLTDNVGETINFKNTIVILTSNVGTKKSISNQSRIGYGSNSETYDEGIISMEIKKRFRPEFINRIDNIIHFNVLSKDALLQLLDIELNLLVEQVAKHGVELKISPSVKTLLIDGSNTPEHGFRPLKRKINDEVKILVAEQLLESDLAEFELIVKDGKIAIV